MEAVTLGVGDHLMAPPETRRNPTFAPVQRLCSARGLGAGPVPKYQGRFRRIGVSLSTHRMLNQLSRSPQVARCSGRGASTPYQIEWTCAGGEGRSISWRWTPGCFRGPSRPNLPCAWVTLPGTSRHGPYAVDCRVRNKAAGPRSTDPAPHRNEWLHCLHGAGDHLSRAMSAAVHLLPLPTRSLPLPRRTLSPVDPSTTTPTPSGPNRGSPGA